jgi:hypothetical protein
MAGGRPKEDLSSLPEGWYNDVLELYEKGGSDEEVKAMIWKWRKSFSNNLWDRWMKEEQEFWETIKIGRQLSAAWWSRNGRENLTNKDFNYTGWYMNMKNRFGWADKQEVKQEDKKTINIIVDQETKDDLDDFMEDLDGGDN